MKASDITPKVIKLSKEISGYWGMEIYKGCWVYTSYACLVKDEEDKVFYRNLITENRGFPIPSISDCLENLKEFNWHLFGANEGFDSLNKTSNYSVSFRHWKLMNDEYWITDVETLNGEGNSLHEALLSALLEVLKEKKE